MLLVKPCLANRNFQQHYWWEFIELWQFWRFSGNSQKGARLSADLDSEATRGMEVETWSFIGGHVDSLDRKRRVFCHQVGPIQLLEHQMVLALCAQSSALSPGAVSTFSPHCGARLSHWGSGLEYNTCGNRNESHNSSFSDTPGAKVPVLFPDDNLGRSTALTVTSSHRMALLGKPGQTMLRSFLLLFFSSSM